ncbi:MAG TPA: metallophosphoesterase [Thermodesulfobacteriota bacterium]|nr:metallophosphoesterase [Deltaproteobacteria bacterium]HNR11905.1 metallophosphoesterase [Thermodesulfobacteriota bacterium]HNU70428.1 metallophosphoesterase [Thermodesulfobacteriota bacterium]
MWKFFAAFITVYSLIHLVLFFRVKVLLPDSRIAYGMVLLAFAALILAPLVTHKVEACGYPQAARTVAMVAFPWMGFVFFAFLATMVMNIFDVCFWLGRSVASIPLPSLNGRKPVLVMLILVVGLCCYSLLEARQLRIERLSLTTDKLPPGSNRLRIVQISDVHLGLLSQRKRLDAVLQKVRAEAPDILVCTGDLVDASAHSVDGLSDALRQTSVPGGKYAIIGNHEVYSGLEHSLDFLEQADFTILRGRAVILDSRLAIVGIDDPAVPTTVDEAALLSSIPAGLFTILLKHRPDVCDESIGRFDLQLSGHTHAGQLYPFRYIVALLHPYIAGFYSLGHGSSLYTSRGTGTWGPPMRFLAPPQITVIDIVSEE